MKSMQVIIVLVPLISSCFSAPLESAVEQPLSRMKRTEEQLTFGYHQNTVRMKKGDPAVPPSESEEKQESQTESETENSGDLLSEVIESQDQAEVTTPEEEDLELLKGHKDESALENLKVEDIEESEEGGEVVKVEDEILPNGDVKETKIAEKAKEVPLADGQTADVKEITEVEKIIPAKDEEDDWYNFLNYGGLYNGIPDKDGDRNRRSAKVGQPLTAENMAENNMRSKRDLTDDELRELLEEEAVFPEEEEFYEDEDEEGADDIIQRILNSPYQSGYGPYEEEFYPVDDQPDVMDDEEKMDILQLLYNRLPDEDTYDDEEELEYEPIVYRGVPGLFVPLQQMNPIPDVNVRKRGDFYPYNYEPSPSSRWGPLLPQQEKRTEEAYERLYRMARALKRYDEDWL